MPLHADELDVDLPLVRRLVDQQLPAYAGLPLRPLNASGSSNALFRLGDDLMVRLPRQPGGSETIDKEARWLPVVAPALPVAVPEVVAAGRPAHGYPERWSVVRWLPGEPPAAGAPTEPALAGDLAVVVSALREAPVPERASADPALRWYRGESLAGLDETMRVNLADCRAMPGLDLDLDRAERLYAEARDLPSYDGPARWLHGDLLAENLLVVGGRLSAVLDFGGLAVGDPTVDLVVAWEVLDAPARAAFRDAVGVDDATWLRGRAWALALALMSFPYYGVTMPARCADRLVMAQAALVDA